MFQLFLAKPNLEEDGVDANASDQWLSRLKQLESCIRSVIASGNRSEARLWLCTSISSIRSITAGDQCELFCGILKSKHPKRSIAAQVWQMVIEKRPQRAGSILARRGYILEKFFDGNSQRILEWFGNFSSAAESEHRKGAKALTQFAFVNRDICWDELEWKGRHGQSPAIVATKPHYVFDLDVVRTVENFLENVPEFWSSDELAESVACGDIVAVDTKFFVDYFVRMMYEDNFEDVWNVINEFLMEERFSYLCQRILMLLDEYELHNFLISLRKVICSSLPGSYDFDISFWLEILLLENNGCPSIDELLVTNSAIRYGRQLIRLLDDEEHEDVKENIEKLTLNNDYAQTDVSILAFMKDCLNMNKAAAIKWFSLQSWLFHYYLFKKCRTVEQWESLLHENGIGFRKCKNFFSANHGGLSEVTDYDLDEDDLHRSGKKSKSRKRKRKKNPNRDLSNDSVLLEMDSSTTGQNLKAGGISWFLSTDGFSCSRDSVDLAEHLAGYCFALWLKWLQSK